MHGQAGHPNPVKLLDDMIWRAHEGVAQIFYVDNGRPCLRFEIEEGQCCPVSIDRMSQGMEGKVCT